MMFIERVFGSAGHFGWEQECARAALIFIYGLAALRLSGRRIFGRWAALDIVVAIVVGSGLSRAMTGNAPLGGTLVATTLLLGVHWLVSHGASRWIGLSRIVEGRPLEIAHLGRINANAMHRHGITRADVRQALRQAGLENAKQAHRIVLEPSGQLCILKSRRAPDGARLWRA